MTESYTIYAICEKHNQFMTLFCVKDLQILCTQCSFSAEHQRHYICPIKQAATFQRRFLESSIQPLKNNVERVEKVLILQGRKFLELKKKVEYRREEINTEFEQIKLCLQNEQEALLKQIQDEELDILSKLNENLVTFSDHMSTLKRLMKEIKGKCVQSDLALLKDVKSIRQRYQNLKHPELSSLGLNNYGFSLLPQYSGLKRIIKQFHRDVSLDPNTAYPQLIVSEDRKSVTFGRTKQTDCYNSRRFYLCPAVLGSKMFNSGRHYWEVDVEQPAKADQEAVKHIKLVDNGCPMFNRSPQQSEAGAVLSRTHCTRWQIYRNLRTQIQKNGTCSDRQYRYADDLDV
ncbi:tripartite motif-containing protein 60-like [Urocitellus parryii]